MALIVIHRALSKQDLAALTFTSSLLESLVFQQQILEIVLQGDSRCLYGIVFGQGPQQLVQHDVHVSLFDPDAPGLEHPHELDFRRRQKNRRRTGTSGARGSADPMNVIPSRSRTRVLNDAIYLRQVQSPCCHILENQEEKVKLER